MDYKLPDGTGPDIAERIRSKWGATPIILISVMTPSADLQFNPEFRRHDWQIYISNLSQRAGVPTRKNP